MCLCANRYIYERIREALKAMRFQEEQVPDATESIDRDHGNARRVRGSGAIRPPFATALHPGK